MKIDEGRGMNGTIKEFIYLYYFSIFLLFVGEFQISIGESALSVPIGFAFIFLIFLLRVLKVDLIITREALLLCGVFILGLLSTLINDSSYLLRALAAMFPLVVSIVVLLSMEKTSFEVRRVFQAAACGGFILAVWVYVDFFQSLSVNGDYYEKKLLVETYLGRSNFLSAFLFFLAVMFFNKNRWLSLFFIGAIFATMSRGGTLVVFSFLIYKLFSSEKYRLAKYIFIIIIVAMVIYFFASNDYDRYLINDAGEYSIPQSFQNRILLWNFSLDKIINSPLLGLSPNGFRTAIEVADDIEDVWGPHNSILLLLLNYGVVGFILYLKYLHCIYLELTKTSIIHPDFKVIKIGFIFLMIFSLFEPLIGSVSFEFLMAIIYVTAKNFNRKMEFNYSESSQY